MRLRAAVVWRPVVRFASLEDHLASLYLVTGAVGDHDECAGLGIDVSEITAASPVMMICLAAADGTRPTRSSRCADRKPDDVPKCTGSTPGRGSAAQHPNPALRTAAPMDGSYAFGRTVTNRLCPPRVISSRVGLPVFRPTAVRRSSTDSTGCRFTCWMMSPGCKPASAARPTGFTS